MEALHSALAFSAIATLNLLYSLLRRRRQNRKLAPRVEFSSGHVKNLERFGDYVVRQLGLSIQRNSFLSAIAEAYLKGYENTSDRNQDRVYSYLSIIYPEGEIDNVFDQLIDEFDSCMLSYFAFHWEHAEEIVNQVLSGYSSIKRLQSEVFITTREEKFERTLKNLKAKQKFFNLAEEIQFMANNFLDYKTLDIMVPAKSDSRSPVLLLVGGGMGADMISVVKDIMKSTFWSSVGKSAVIIEVDDLRKHNDGLEDANILENTELIQRSSTDEALSLLVSAVNGGSDVIFIGSMSWEPFVLQTIEMVKSVHLKTYKKGPGYTVGIDGSVEQQFWEPVETIPNCHDTQISTDSIETLRKPYRVEFVGVICDAHLAVIRGFRSALVTKHALSVKDLLVSHKRFALSLPNYIKSVDNARIYSTNRIRGLAKLIGWKEKNTDLLVNPEAIKELKKITLVNENARNVLELYKST